MHGAGQAGLGAFVVAATACGGDSLRTQPEPPQVDLVAGAVVGPAAAAVGGVLEYEVGLRNGGSERAEDGWFIRVYFSEDAVLGPEDMLVDQFVTRRALVPGATDTYARGFKVPGAVMPGEYHLVSELDATGVFDEPRKDNNTGVSERRTRIDPAETGL